MSIDLSPSVQSRLLASAQAEGVSVEEFLNRLIDEREELASIFDRAAAGAEPLGQEAIQEKIERAFMQSERDEVVDGDKFTAALLSELEEIERKRRVG